MIAGVITSSHVTAAWSLLVVLGFFDAVWEGIKAVFGFVVDVSTSIVAAITAFWRIMQPILEDVWHVVRPIWDHVLKPFWHVFNGWILQLKKWWERFVKPVTDFFQKVHEFERIFYNATFGPILDTISDLQKLIALSGLSHTAIGQAITNVLHDIVGKVERIYFDVTDPVNKVISKIEGYILDVSGLLNSTLLLNSIFRDFVRIWTQWWDIGIGRLTQEGRDAIRARGTRFTFEHRLSTMLQLIEFGSGPLAADVERGVAAFRASVGGTDPDWFQPGEPPL